MQTATSIQVSRLTIADTNTSIPGNDDLKFLSFGIPSIGSEKVVFYGCNGDKCGIYFQSIATDLVSENPQALNLVCNLSSALPTIGNPTSIDPDPVIDDKQICFKASNGITQGIYSFNTTTSEIGELATFPASEKISSISAKNGMVAFQKNNAVNNTDNGIWLIQKNNLTRLVVGDNSNTPVQILGNPMNPNNMLIGTSRPYLGDNHLIFVGKLQNAPTGHTEDALIVYNLAFKGLLSVMRKGDKLPSGNQVVGKHPFISPISYRDGHIACNVEYNNSDASSTRYMMIVIDSKYEISEITAIDTINPVPGVSVYSSSFEQPPMTSSGKVCFAADVELTSNEPSTNLFGNVFGSLSSYIEGYTYPYNGKSYLQKISHNGNGLDSDQVVARCFWNNGQSENEDNLGIYLFGLSQ
ncbi:MAG: hypothetical protein AAFQ94_17595 [Bacteroidota bacterium]